MGSKIQLHRSVHHVEDYRRLKFHHDRRSFHCQIDENTRRRFLFNDIIPYLGLNYIKINKLFYRKVITIF